MFIDDIVTLMVLGGVPLSSIGATTQASIPTPVPMGGWIHVIEYGGMGPERTHNDILVSGNRPAFQRPHAQFRAHAPTYDGAMSLAYQAYYAVSGKRNFTVSGGTYYREIEAIQEPFDDGPDANNNAQVVFNVRVIKNPS